MKNKLILITLTILILLCGCLMVSCSANKSDYVGTWSKENSVAELTITKESDTTFSIEKNTAKGNIIGEFKDGIITVKLLDGDYIYSLKDGVLTEKTPKETVKYKKAK